VNCKYPEIVFISAYCINICVLLLLETVVSNYSGADKSLARPGREQATAPEDFDVHISYL